MACGAMHRQLYDGNDILWDFFSILCFVGFRTNENGTKAVKMPSKVHAAPGFLGVELSHDIAEWLGSCNGG